MASHRFGRARPQNDDRWSHPTAAHATAAHVTAAHVTAAHVTAAHVTAAHVTAAHAERILAIVDRDGVRKIEALTRKPAERTPADLQDRIGAIIDVVPPQEARNDVAAAGDEPD